MATALIVIDVLNPYGHQDAIARPEDMPFIVKARHSVFYETRDPSWH